MMPSHTPARHPADADAADSSAGVSFSKRELEALPALARARGRAPLIDVEAVLRAPPLPPVTYAPRAPPARLLPPVSDGIRVALRDGARRALNMLDAQAVVRGVELAARFLAKDGLLVAGTGQGRGFVSRLVGGRPQLAPAPFKLLPRDDDGAEEAPRVGLRALTPQEAHGEDARVVNERLVCIACMSLALKAENEGAGEDIELLKLLVLAMSEAHPVPDAVLARLRADPDAEPAGYRDLDEDDRKHESARKEREHDAAFLHDYLERFHPELLPQPSPRPQPPRARPASMLRRALGLKPSAQSVARREAFERERAEAEARAKAKAEDEAARARVEKEFARWGPFLEQAEWRIATALEWKLAGPTILDQFENMHPGRAVGSDGKLSPEGEELVNSLLENPASFGGEASAVFQRVIKTVRLHAAQQAQQAQQAPSATAEGADCAAATSA